MRAHTHATQKLMRDRSFQTTVHKPQSQTQKLYRSVASAWTSCELGKAHSFTKPRAWESSALASLEKLSGLEAHPGLEKP